MGVESVSPDSAPLTCSDADTTRRSACQDNEDDSRAEDDVSKSPVAALSGESEPSDVYGKSAGFSNGDCSGHERLEIVEPLADCEERVSPECTATSGEQCNGVTAAPDAMESSSDAGREAHVYNGAIRFVDDDDDSGVVPADAAALSDGESDSRRHRVVDEEVDGRGMLFSENDVELGTGERETKTDDGLQNLSLDLGNIRQRFESPQESTPSVADRSALGRSESLLQRLEKYQSVAAGDRNGDAHSSAESDDEESSVVKETRAKEKVVYEGLSSLKSQWETGTVNSHQERTEETKEELAKLRKKMCLGRSESMRQVYQKAVEDANRIQAGRAEQISVEGQEARATSIKEKFEAGVVTQETEAEKIERLQREKEEDLSVFNETGIAHEAKNIFKQLDAEVARQSSGAPAASLARSPSNRWSVPRPPTGAVSPGDVVRSSDPVRDVEVETTEVSERFKFFENFKEQQKERKRFEMTPPRDTGKEPSPEFQVQRDPNVVRAADPVEEVVVTDTARRMRERFRELEVNANREELPQGPKPLKRITPPREYTREDAHEDSPEIQRDPDVVQCSYRVEDNVVVEADRAKSMRARFENWDAERVAREMRRNEENGEDECLPMADTAKNLRAKFEAIRDESERRETERPKPKVNRFV